jgi:hypothetical protein
MHETRLMVLDPGHFHAALMQNEMYLGISRKVLVYAPLGPEVLDYLNRVALFNSRGQNPTAWEIDLHTGPDFQQRMLRERPGNRRCSHGTQPAQNGSYSSFAGGRAERFGR